MLSAARAYILIGIGANVVVSLIDAARRTPAYWLTWSLLLGSGPNFFAVPAIAFTVLGVFGTVRSQTTCESRHARRIALGVVCCTVVTLVSWEYVQRASGRMYFDWNDVVATCMSGALCSGIVWVRPPLRSGDIHRET